MTKHQVPDGPFTIADAALVGTGKQALARMLRDGTVRKVLAGLYWATTDLVHHDARCRHVAIAKKVLESLDGEFVLARETAALVHGLATPRWLPDGPKKVSLYALNNRNARNAPGIQITVTPLHIGDVTQVDGLPVTSLCRTAIDLARGMSLAFSLIPLDSALRLGATPASLLRMTQQMKGWSGTKLLRSIIPLADGLSESALESAARGTCLAADLPSPQLQHELFGASGRLYRVDMVWLEARLILEPDGWGKYGNEGSEQQANFRREKYREDDIREANFTVLRVTWEGLGELPARVARHLRTR